MMSNNEPNIKRKSRILSRFLCQEMMYDFVTGKLSDDRKAAMQEFIKTCENTQEDLEVFEQAINYCEQLSTLTPSEPLVDKIQKQSSITQKFIYIFKWSNWPQPLKWSLQGVAVSVLAASFAIFIPWEKFQIELDLKSKGSALYVAEQKTEHAVDNESAPTKVVKPEPVVEAIASEEKPEQNLNVISVDTDQQESVPTPTPKAQSKQKPKEEAVVEQKQVEESKGRSAVVKSNLKGSLTRIYMSVNSFKEFSVVVENFIRTIGGEKAGQVELGWEKDSTTRYFHFTIPEKDYPKLLQLLRTKANTKIMRTPHSRIMPDGKMRLILEIGNDD